MTALNLRRASEQDQTPANVSQIVNLINDAYRWSETELWVDHKEHTDTLKIDALNESGMIILAKKMMTLRVWLRSRKWLPTSAGSACCPTTQIALAQASARPS